MVWLENHFPFNIWSKVFNLKNHSNFNFNLNLSCWWPKLNHSKQRHFTKFWVLVTCSLYVSSFQIFHSWTLKSPSNKGPWEYSTVAPVMTHQHISVSELQALLHVINHFRHCDSPTLVVWLGTGDNRKKNSLNISLSLRHSLFQIYIWFHLPFLLPLRESVQV